MPAPKTLFTALISAALMLSLSAPRPAQADVYIAFSSGHGKHTHYKRGFGYGHYPPYAVKRPYYYGHRQHWRHGRHGYGRGYAYGYTAPWVFKKPYYGTHRFAYRPPIERKQRRVWPDRIIWNTAPSGYRSAPQTLYCAPFEDRVRIDGKWQDVTGRACQQPDGSWRIVSR